MAADSEVMEEAGAEAESESLTDVEMVSQTQCCGGLKKSAVCSVL